jgi:hypothetical protein
MSSPVISSAPSKVEWSLERPGLRTSKQGGSIPDFVQELHPGHRQGLLPFTSATQMPFVID